MTQSRTKFTNQPIYAWRIDRQRLYTKLGALGGMADHANTKIKPDWSWQGKLSLAIGSRPEYSPGYTMEVRVDPSMQWLAERVGHINARQVSPKHRIHVRCPHCFSWQPFGRLHQHILTKRCCEASRKANTSAQVPSLQSTQP